MTKLMVEIPEHQYNNIKAVSSINLGRVPYKGIIMYAINAIKRGRVFEQEPRWISVKDRLPQKGEYGDVLVTFVPPAGTLWATVMIARYSDLMGIAKPCFHIGEVGKKSFENITPKVTAWMPLPQPYRQGE